MLLAVLPSDSHKHTVPDRLTLHVVVGGLCRVYLLVTLHCACGLGGVRCQTQLERQGLTPSCSTSCAVCGLLNLPLLSQR